MGEDPKSLHQVQMEGQKRGSRRKANEGSSEGGCGQLCKVLLYLQPLACSHHTVSPRACFVSACELGAPGEQDCGVCRSSLISNTGPAVRTRERVWVGRKGEARSSTRQGAERLNPCPRCRATGQGDKLLMGL